MGYAHHSGKKLFRAALFLDTITKAKAFALAFVMDNG
jgi:hypothetical protein